MTQGSELDIFGDRLDAYGANLARWPAAEAAEAAHLLAVSRDARARHLEAKRFDALVAEAAWADAPNGFAFRVMAEVSARRQDRFSWLFGSPGRAGLAGASFCAMALFAGLALGSLVGPNGAMASSPDLGAAIEMSLLDGDL